jgi:PleD family two-component response regulator
MEKYVIAAVDDMFFAAKIRATASHLGLDVRFAKSVEALIETAREELPLLIIADLHSEKFNPFKLAERLKADEQLRGVTLLGFFSHVQTALQQRAAQAGFNRIMPRSAFSKHLPEILEGIGL